MFCEFLPEHRNHIRKFEFSENPPFLVYMLFRLSFFKLEILNLFLIYLERKLLIFS